MKPKAIAYHEAGHAVAQHSFGRTLERVTIVPDPEAHGAMYGELVPSALLERPKNAALTPAEVEETERTFIVLLAGGVAERLAGDYKPGASGRDQVLVYDLLVIVAEILGFEKDAYIRDVTARTTKFVQSNSAAIELLANELLRRKTLSGEAVGRLLEGQRA